MSTDIFSRYTVRPSANGAPGCVWYVFDQSEQPARTVAVCTEESDAADVRLGLALLAAQHDALELPAVAVAPV